jgi:hypothetical protein
MDEPGKYLLCKVKEAKHKRLHIITPFMYNAYNREIHTD